MTTIFGALGRDVVVRSDMVRWRRAQAGEGEREARRQPVRRRWQGDTRMLDVIRARLPEGSQVAQVEDRLDGQAPEERRGSARPGFLDGAAAMIGLSKAIAFPRTRAAPPCRRPCPTNRGPRRFARRPDRLRCSVAWAPIGRK